METQETNSTNLLTGENISNEKEDNEVSTKLDSSAHTPAPQGYYTIVITGLDVKKPKKQDDITIENLENTEEAFKVSESVYINPDFQTQLAKYEFSLKSLLEKCKHKLQDGLIFQSQVVTNGFSKVHSIPKLFPDFILLVPPTITEVTPKEKQAGLHISWDYSLHAVGYRLELVAQQDNSVVFSKVLRSKSGANGESIIFKNELKDVSCSKSDVGYQLQMYSLGFGHDLIRCLKPTVANRTVHVIPAELQYLSDSNTIQVQFKPHSMKRGLYVVDLYRLTKKSETKPSYLKTSTRHRHKAHSETVVADIPLKYCQHQLHSGDLVVAWVYSAETDNIYIGAPKEEVLVLGSPEFRVCSLIYRSDGTIKGLRLAWSGIPKSCGYRCGFYLTDKQEHVSPLDLQETEVTVHFTGSLEKVVSGGFCRFQVYVTALGKPRVQVVGALSLDKHRFQCIINTSVKKGSPIVFTSVILQHIWTANLLSLAAHKYSSLASNCNPRHFVYPTEERFPSIRLPRSIEEKFWYVMSEDQLFGNHDCSYARDILTAPPQKKSFWSRLTGRKSQATVWKREDPFAKPFSSDKSKFNFTYSKLHLLFYTRCWRESEPGKKTHYKLDIEIKMETKESTTKVVPKVAADAVSSTAPEPTSQSLADNIDNKNEKTGSSGLSVDMEDSTQDVPQEEEEQEVNPEEQEESIPSNEEWEPVSLDDESQHQDETCETTESQPLSSENTPSESAESGGILGAVRGFASKALKGVKALVSDSYNVLHEKKRTIDLPYGVGPKVYCHLITYTPTGINKAAKQSLKPRISVTISPSSEKCHHEDTHLFVRFSGYRYNSKTL